MSGWLRLRGDRRGAVALMVGLMSPVLLMMTSIVTDTGFWMVGQTRLQIAADAGALGGAFLLPQASFKAMTAATQLASLQAVALAEAQGAATKLAGTMTTPVTVSYTATTVTVTITSTMPSLFYGPIKLPPPLVRATATATLVPPTACTVAISPTGTGILVDGAGTLTAANCPIGSDSTDAQSIYLNSGTITATAIVASGGIVKSNSGSNVMSPDPGTPYAAPTGDPDPQLSGGPTVPHACDVNGASTYGSGGQTYNFAPLADGNYVFCGDVTIGGNASTANFAPGSYFVDQGNLTFNNALSGTLSGGHVRAGRQQA